jgi:hypothetical protein
MFAAAQTVCLRSDETVEMSVSTPAELARAFALRQAAWSDMGNRFSALRNPGRAAK